MLYSSYILSLALLLFSRENICFHLTLGTLNNVQCGTMGKDKGKAVMVEQTDSLDSN